MHAMTEAPAAAAATGGKYLTFQLAGAEYGVSILYVREIIALADITPVPQVPAYVRGVINLRGRVIPVVDLGRKLGLAPAALGDETCIVIVDVGGPVGLLVDAVCDVLELAAAQVSAAPALPNAAAGADGGYVLGLGQGRAVVTILLDIERALAAEGPPGAPRPEWPS